VSTTGHRRLAAALLLASGLAVSGASAHPSSAIVVDAVGAVWFTDNGGEGILWRIERGGTLTAVQRGRLQGLHWFALDREGLVSPSVLGKRLRRVPLSGSTAALLKTDGFPLVVDRQGTLYYAQDNREITRRAPDGTGTTVGPTAKAARETFGGWITGLAVSAEGHIYVAYTSAVVKISRQGTVTTMADAQALGSLSGAATKPSLRGLDVDSRGRVYAASQTCRCVVRVTAGARVETVMKADPPWSPTGVAIHGGDVYVLEYAHEDQLAEEWLPRVRKLAPNGTITTLVSITNKDRATAP
jgi:sugar lactone lactonase YvrE